MQHPHPTIIRETKFKTTVEKLMLPAHQHPSTVRKCKND